MRELLNKIMRKLGYSPESLLNEFKILLNECQNNNNKMFRHVQVQSKLNANILLAHAKIKTSENTMQPYNMTVYISIDPEFVKACLGRDLDSDQASFLASKFAVALEEKFRHPGFIDGALDWARGQRSIWAASRLREIDLGLAIALRDYLKGTREIDADKAIRNLELCINLKSECDDWGIIYKEGNDARKEQTGKVDKKSEGL